MPYTWTPFQRRDEIPVSEIPSLAREVRTETFASAFEENPIELMARYNERRTAETGYRGPRQGIVPITRINAEQAKKMADDAGVPLSYDTDTSREAVELDIERKKTELRRQDIFARSPGGVGLGAQRLGIAIGTTLSDPISGLLNFVPVVGQTRYARWMQGATRAGRVGIRAGTGAAEGLVGAAIYEPILYSAKQAEQADYDATDSLLNLSLGTVLGAGLHTVGGTTADAYRSFRGISDPYVKVTPAIQSAINAGKVDAPIITKADIDAGGVRLEAKLVETAQVASAPVVPARPDVSIAETPDREIVARSANGETIARRRGDTLQVTESRTDELAQKTGEGTARIEALIKEADKRGLKFASDTKVSVAAARVYDRLEREGYTVTRNPASPDGEGNVVSDVNRPVFEVTGSPAPKNAAEAVANATPAEREAALRTAVSQMSSGEDVNVSRIYGNNEVKKADIDASAERSVEADEKVKAQDDSLEALEEDANIERQLADDQAKQLGIEGEPLKAVDNYIAKIKRWERAAELAQVCLVRGG